MSIPCISWSMLLSLLLPAGGGGAVSALVIGRVLGLGLGLGLLSFSVCSPCCASDAQHENAAKSDSAALLLPPAI